MRFQSYFHSIPRPFLCETQQFLVVTLGYRLFKLRTKFKKKSLKSGQKYHLFSRLGYYKTVVSYVKHGRENE